MEGTHESSSTKIQDPNNAVDLDDDPTRSADQNLDNSSFLVHREQVNGEDRKQEGAHGEYPGRERLKRHREEVAGKVLIPDTWGQEDLLKEWIDCSTFDMLLAPNGIASARQALVDEGRRASTSPRLRIESRC